MLRAAVTAGHGPARVRLAAFLTCQYSDADAASHAAALRLLSEAVASGVPGVRNLLGVTLWDDGAVDDAEDVLRAAVAEGDLDAQVNLAGVPTSRPPIRRSDRCACSSPMTPGNSIPRCYPHA